MINFYVDDEEFTFMSNANNLLQRYGEDVTDVIINVVGTENLLLEVSQQNSKFENLGYTFYIHHTDCNMLIMIYFSCYYSVNSQSISLGLNVPHMYLLQLCCLS